MKYRDSISYTLDTIDMQAHNLKTVRQQLRRVIHTSFSTSPFFQTCRSVPLAIVQLHMIGMMMIHVSMIMRTLRQLRMMFVQEMVLFMAQPNVDISRLPLGILLYQLSFDVVHIKVHILNDFIFQQHTQSLCRPFPYKYQVVLLFLYFSYALFFFNCNSLVKHICGLVYFEIIDVL